MMNRSHTRKAIRLFSILLVFQFVVFSHMGSDLGRMSEQIAIHVRKEPHSRLRLSDGRSFLTTYLGHETASRALERNEARPLSLASGDFDGDGKEDLVAGYAGPNGGIVVL